jgi:hypothetical protein
MPVLIKPRNFMPTNTNDFTVISYRPEHIFHLTQALQAYCHYTKTKHAYSRFGLKIFYIIIIENPLI